MTDTLADLEARLVVLKRLAAEEWARYQQTGGDASRQGALDCEREIDDLERVLAERRRHAWALLMMEARDDAE